LTGDRITSNFKLADEWLSRWISVSNHQATEVIVRLRESVRNLTSGQTMTEYAMILAGVAVVAFTAYEFLGQDINNLVSWQSIDNDLTGL
jgi:Flp pilus assembly pilin Flp